MFSKQTLQTKAALITSQRGFTTISLAMMIMVIPTAALVGMRFYNAVQKSAQIQKSSMSKSQMNNIKNWLLQNSSDPDADGRIELLKENTGNTLPLAVPMKSTDDYGAAFKYYTWDLNLVNGNALYSQNVAAPPIAGLVGRIISSGKDGVFQSTSASTVAAGDDILLDTFYTDTLSVTDNSGWSEDSANNKIIQKNTSRWVAIGTTTPLSPLHTTGTLTVGNGAAAGSNGNLQITTGGAAPIANRILFGTDGTGKSMAFGKNQGGVVTDIMSIKDNGYVGIGNTAPTQRLDVTGSILGSEVYSNGWFRNKLTLTGLYNETDLNYIYSEGSLWTIATQQAGGATGIRLRNGNGGTTWGHYYADATASGLLHNLANWSYRVVHGGKSDTSYGGASIWGETNGYPGLAFRGLGGDYTGTLMMNGGDRGGAMGFYNESGVGGAGWKFYVDAVGNSYGSGTGGSVRVPAGIQFADGTIQTSASQPIRGYNFYINGYGDVIQGQGTMTLIGAQYYFTGTLWNAALAVPNGTFISICRNSTACARTVAMTYNGGSQLVIASVLPVNSPGLVW